MSSAELASFSSEQQQLLEQLLAAEGIDLSEMAIPRREGSGPAPLSFAQHRLWFLDQFHSHNAAYHVAKAIRLQGQLDGELLQNALDSLLERHEILRTTYSHENAAPVQVVQPPQQVSLSYYDLRAGKPAPQDEAVRCLVEKEARRPFDLARDMMIRAAWLRLDEDDHLLLLTIYHIAADAWSLDILLREFEELYKAQLEGREPDLAPLPIQYADFAVWERQRFSKDHHQQHMEYWKQRLSGAPAVLDLPTDRPRPAVRSMRGAMAQRELPECVCTELRSLARQEGATFFMLLLAVFQVLLNRWSGQTDLCVGSPITGRSKSEIENLVGFFLNTAVFRTDLSGEPSFREALGRVREMALEAFAHQDVPFDQLVEALHPHRSTSHSPLFQVMFVLQDAKAHKLNLTGREAHVSEVDLGASRFDLNLTVQETGNGLRCCLDYDTDLFEARTAERLLGHFEVLLRGVLADPDRSIATLPLLTDAEQQQLLVDWNATAGEYPQRCIHELFEERAAETPNAIAVVLGEQRLSYGELNRRADLLAQRLAGLGVESEALVGLYTDRSIEMVVALLAILKAGGAYIPLDPAYPKERLAFMVEDSGLSVMLTQSHLLNELPAPVNHVVALDTFDWNAQPVEATRPAVTPGNLVYILYTSGSTGKPKGVAIQHGSLVNLLESIRRETGYSQRDRLLAITTLSFDIAGLELYLPLMTGSTLTLVSREDSSDANRLAELIVSSGATFMQATPATWRLLLENGWQGKEDLTILCGGEKMPRSLGNRLVDSARTVWNVYGPTETTIWSTIAKVEKGEGLVTIGRPLANTQIYILDSHLQPTPVSVPGELYIGGDGLARGYLNRPELTDEKFVPNPFGPGRLYKTGDLVRWRVDGNLEFLHRLDDQVKLRGFRIELGEIESVLMRHEGIKAACALVREDTPGDAYIAGYYVAKPHEAPSNQKLAEFLRRHLPEYMLPSRFVPMERFPLTPNGKIDRRALPAPVIQMQPAKETATPQTPMQQLVAEVWANALGIEGVGLDDNFFDLGGHSLLSMEVIRTLHQRTGVRLAPQDMVFQSLGQLAGHYEERSKKGTRPEGFMSRLSGALQKVALRTVALKGLLGEGLQDFIR